MAITLVKNIGLDDTASSTRTSNICEPTAAATGLRRRPRIQAQIGPMSIRSRGSMRPPVASAATRSFNSTRVTGSGSGYCNTSLRQQTKIFSD